MPKVLSTNSLLGATVLESSTRPCSFGTGEWHAGPDIALDVWGEIICRVTGFLLEQRSSLGSFTVATQSG